MICPPKSKNEVGNLIQFFNVYDSFTASNEWFYFYFVFVTITGQICMKANFTILPSPLEALCFIFKSVSVERNKIKMAIICSK